MGILGLTTYLIILFLFFKRGFHVFKHATQERYRQMSAAIMSGFAGLLLIGLTNASLVIYRFIIIWALVIATIETLYWKVRANEY